MGEVGVHYALIRPNAMASQFDVVPARVAVSVPVAPLDVKVFS